ncbi:MAG: prolyl oligopeptidase family serine peptidase [Solirubrobacteraceae bacterium]
MSGTTDSHPPVAERRPHVRELHGRRDGDDYAWMRDGEDRAFHEYLAAERAYYDARMGPLAALARTLAAETASRFPTGPEDSVAWERGGFVYRTRVPEGADQAQLLRRGPDRPGELVLLDGNLVAAATGFAELGVCEPSPDGALLAWSADTSGAEIYELRIRNLSTGEDLPEVIARTYTGVAWSADSRFLFYLVPDDCNRPWQVWRHELGTPAGADVLVLEERDRRFELTLCRSRSGGLGVITAASRDTTEVSVLRLDAPLEPPIRLEPRRRAVEYRIDHERERGTLYLVSDAGEPEFTLMRASVAAPGRDGWEPVASPAIAPARTDTRLISCDVFAGHLLLTLRRDGSLLLAIADHDGGEVREVATAMPAGTIAVEHAEDYERGAVIIREESLIEPPLWSELDLRTGGRRPLKRLEVPGYDPARYRTERLHAPAPDGTPIPVTIARSEDVALDGRAPCLLYGYGAYESSLDPEFDRSLASLLDRGVVYAVAHIRGGGEGGRGWWQQGRLRSKPTTFSDYAAMADWLAGGADGAGALVDGTRIVTRGLSAGGLLQGAVYSMRPDRWRAVVAEVPFVDVVTTMLDPSIPLTINEWDEWGDPRDPDDYACMRSYSPYDNPPPGPRPPLLVTGAVHDPRVGIHEPAKWVARLRATNVDRDRVLFRAELGVGAHVGPSGRSGQIGYEAEVQAFILDALGIGA